MGVHRAQVSKLVLSLQEIVENNKLMNDKLKDHLSSFTSPLNSVWQKDNLSNLWTITVRVSYRIQAVQYQYKVSIYITLVAKLSHSSVVTENPESEPRTSSSSRRAPRLRRKLAVAPYDPASRSARKNAQQPAHFPLPPCPRAGIQWIASENQPRAAWEMTTKPHEAASTTVVNLLNTLTAYDLKDEIASCADLLLEPQRASYGDKHETLSQLAKRCTDMDHKRGAFDFHLMVALMKFSFECAR